MRKVVTPVAGDGHPPRAVLDPWGDSSLYPADVLRRSWDEVDERTDLVVVLDGTRSWSQDQLGEFVVGVKRFGVSGARVVCVGGAPALTRLLQTTAFDRVVPIVESYAEALELLRRPIE